MNNKDKIVKPTDVFFVGIKGIVAIVAIVYLFWALMLVWFVSIPLIVLFFDYVKKFILIIFNKIKGSNNEDETTTDKKVKNNLNNINKQHQNPKNKIKKEDPFVTNIKNQISNKTKLDIYWPDGVEDDILSRKNFTAYINNALIKTPFVVHMNKEGVVKVTFPNSSLKTVYFDNCSKEKKSTKDISDTAERSISLDNLPDNMYINKDGEVRIKPNYKAIAQDWFSKNFSYVNMLYNEKTVTENGREKFLIPKNKLPDDVEVWKEIGMILLSQANVKFYIDKKGIIVKNKI